MRPIDPVTTPITLPIQIQQVKHWLELLQFEHVVLVEPKNGTYSFLLPIRDSPDIHISLDKDYTHISFFSNGLTSLSAESDEKVHRFLRDIMGLQSSYFTSRVISTGPKEEIRVFLGFRLIEMSMYRFSRKIQELCQFVKEVADLIDKNELNEDWRDLEQEPKYPDIDLRERVRFL